MKSGVGLSADLDQTLSELYQRHVEHYAALAESTRRSDEDVWRVFREPLDKFHVTPRLRPKQIVASSYEYEFEHSWKNEIWHVCEPVSFDMVEAGSMLEKANRWVGRATSLMDSSEPFRIHMLLGEPTLPVPAFVKAQNILNKMPVKTDSSANWLKRLLRSWGVRFRNMRETAETMKTQGHVEPWGQRKRNSSRKDHPACRMHGSLE